MDQSQEFKSLQDQIQTALIATTRTAGQISSEDLGFHRSLNPEVGTALDEQSERLLALSTYLLRSASSISELRAPVLQDADDVENNWRAVVDVVDSLLEKTDGCLDEYTGVIKRRDADPVASPSKSRKNPSSSSGLFRNLNLVKPQLAFIHKPDNSDESPWKPLLTTKPHATVPLEDSLGTFTDEFEQNQYRHPYETEILQHKYPDALYQTVDPIPYLPFENTSATYIDTYEGVLEMLEELKTATEIAVDLEHHETRSYVGLVSLMQISTRQKDWIIDTLQPWRQDLQVLNEVFADPGILKVLHGAYMDIVWLQRDLGLYIVGLFDTHHASRVLGYQGGSLAFLLKKFIDFDADKQYQLADWRIRPLPEEMFSYARSDTHFLLYIYDNIRNELISRSDTKVPEENKIDLVLQLSKEVSLKRHERLVYNAESGKGPGGWYNALVKMPTLFNNEQFAVFKAVHEWRDQIARIDDDSTHFVMPNSAIVSIAKLLPMDLMALLGIVKSVSHSVKSRADELLALIKSARARGKNGPSMIDVLRPNTVGAIAKASFPALATKPEEKTAIAPVDQGQLRSEISSFWGGAFGSSIWDGPPTPQEGDGLRLAVPLPRLSVEVFATSSPLADRSRSKPDTSLQSSSEATPARKADDKAFIIKRGGKRKSEALSEPEDERTGEYDISFNDDNQKALDKAAQKAQRKAAKKAKKKAAEAESISVEVENEDEDDEPFDYSKAESVLHGKRKDGDSGGSKRQKPFDPYQKSTDAPKGMRRLQKEQPGKSITFKS
ncbi:hypothetical protein B7494_g6954 [Chlorociboria aeruginascens]|nr:hypothetical protein B7494_g6954 [Chlorociboria aeruginascens]